ncbi:hypothetical protein [Flaviaesturariibacter amylovorans]|uniref:DUF5689 domain-containing protein n=1 Tax=Flaviaesturariibacter amylovorans TaxID=1084520 RepID=A0ABP8G721_9BACT
MKSFHSSTYRLPLLAAGGLLLLLSACKKEKSASELSPQEEQTIAFTSARSDAQSHGTFDDIFDNILGVNSEVGFGNTGVFGRPGSGPGVDSIPPCVQLTVVRLSQQGPFPVRISIDFGSGCTGRDGRTRSGRIVTDYSGRLLDSGSVAISTFENYRIDSIRIQGVQRVRNLGGPGRRFSVEVHDARITRANGDYVLWNGNRVITQTEGQLTPNLAIDDVFTVTGAASGQTRNSGLIHTWTSTIELPLRKRFTCRWFSAGTVRSSRSGLAGNSPWVGLLHYGQGQCDNLASFTVNNSTYQISLP